jgi:hypothetical protein
VYASVCFQITKAIAFSSPPLSLAHSFHPPIAMSSAGSKRSLTEVMGGDSPALSRQVRPYHSHSSSSNANAAAAAKSSSSVSSTVMRAAAATAITRLYAAVLGIVFSFSDLPQLAALLRVCCAWRAVVRSMRPLQFKVTDWDSCTQTCAMLSQERMPLLSRHVAELEIVHGATTRSPLFLYIAQQLPHLTALNVYSSVWETSLPEHPPVMPPHLPAALRQLQLGCISPRNHIITTELQAAPFNDLLASAAQLQHLEDVQIFLGNDKHLNTTVLLEALPRMASLRKVSVTIDAELPEVQLALLRSLAQVEHLEWAGVMPLHRLLTDHHQLTRLHSISSCSFSTPQDAAAMTSLPMLTALQLSYASGNLHFLMALPRLSSLTLEFRRNEGIAATDALAALRTCTQVTQLHLKLQSNTCQLSDEQLKQLLPCMPLLRDLKIHNATCITSLTFLRCAALHLQHLDLAHFSPQLANTETEHLNVLQSLQTLCLVNIVKWYPVRAAQYQPPSLLIPSLRTASIANNICRRRQ